MTNLDDAHPPAMIRHCSLPVIAKPAVNFPEAEAISTITCSDPFPKGVDPMSLSDRGDSRQDFPTGVRSLLSQPLVRNDEMCNRLQAYANACWVSG